MGRRPNIWNIRTRGCRGSNSWVSGYTKQTNEISKYDIEKLELLPFIESRKFVDHYRGRHLRTPIDRFLRDQVGRDYDEVFSELVNHIPKKLHHCLSMESYKMPSSFHPSETRWYLNSFAYRFNHGEPFGFFVDLETRVLGYVERIGRKYINEEEREKPVSQPFRLDTFKTRYDYSDNYVFKQLVKYADFEVEAAKMKHCIRSYWSRCTNLAEKTSIWSLSIRNHKTLTIQITNNQIVQVRGLSNRRATETEQIVITQWAIWLKLTILEYAF
jgi:PcfJ-like protein